VEKNVWGNFRGFTLIYEENLRGGNLKLRILMFWSVVHVDLVRRGDS
jgi:hypothetical protein